MTFERAIQDIIRINDHIAGFWGDGGWAPTGAAQILSKSRLDWHVSLSRTLQKWCAAPPPNEHDGCLILAWANLGALVEGTMKWFLSVFYDDYAQNPLKKLDEMREPDQLAFKTLTDYFTKNVWTAHQKERWYPFAEQVRERRNAIHAYEHRIIGDFDKFQEAVVEYRSFLLDHEGQVPYPDEQYTYPADIHRMHMDEQ